ncbi:hypothetical protein D4741_19995 [Pseudoalteromonas gelatinilytica]|uniref:Uncharacterized protein n=1 Tax=Pseudoalteromonas gelatinilytica TaxID=1703256 RepID=A0A3A3EDT8_9GAMM|nr:hypothetical protein [Pseudoalteromonas profundi]RJF32055.1 hypothetical protein D4741_19995 [Pseudoalteromonas profundi]
MADKTFGFKVSEDLYEKVKTVIETSGITSKDWFERAVVLYEMNAIKQGSSDYTQDLTELEHHTTRMYELIANMIERSIHLKDQAVKEVADKLESKESIITDLQQHVKQLKIELSLSRQEVEVSVQKAIDSEEKLKASQGMLETNQALVSEYKEKNDTLNGLVVKYQAYADENEKLKKDFESEKSEMVREAIEERATLTKQVEELTEKFRTSSEDLRILLQQAEQDKANYEREITVLSERKELERERAVVELRSQHNEEVRKLYDEMANLRKMNEDTRERMQLEIEQLKQRKEN